MSKIEQERVGNFIEDYLQIRKEIALIIFLIDIRHMPSENDKLMYHFIINTGFPCIILANKADKLAPAKVDTAVLSLQQALNPLKDLKFFHSLLKRKFIQRKFGKKLKQN